ncbi:MAG: PD40 domain-containing protein [Candidatus Omnitrophica bacterium]|nr:PD40 domain-containing protein [Candidatus Omnitrophota bacterium]
MFMLLVPLVFIMMSYIPALSDESAWMRQPALSPDGSAVVFSYQGDLFRVSASGGDAILLTRHEAYDGHPVWSHDGSHIAFASDRYGNFDVYVMPAEGGEAVRLTHHSADDIPSDFTIGDQSVIFSSIRVESSESSLFPYPRMPELYSISAAGGTPKQILTTAAFDARFNSGGTQLLYHDYKGYEDPWRKHHRSSVTRDVWLYDLSSGEHTKLSDFDGEDRNPVWGEDDQEYYYLSEESGVFNVWRSSTADPQNKKQITSHKDHPVRYISRSKNGLLAYSHHGELYKIRPGGQPQKIEVRFKVDAPANDMISVPITGGVSEMALSPKGKEIAFISRGEVFVTSIDFSTTKRITDTPEQERSVSFSPKGDKLLYAGERNGSWNLYETELAQEEEKMFSRATQLRETVLLETDEEAFQPQYSPDGKEVAFLADRETLKVINLETKNIRTVLPQKYLYSYSDGDIYYHWSPDGKWFAVDFIARQKAFITNIGLVSSDGSALPVDITQSGYTNMFPKWAMDGKAVIWLSERYGMRSHGSWGSQLDVMAAFLNQDSYDKFRLSKEEYELKQEEEKEKKKEEKKDEKAEDKKDGDEIQLPDPVTIDWDGIEDRIMRLTIHSSHIADYALTPDAGKLYFLSHYEKGYDLWVHDFREKETKRLEKFDGGIGQFILNKEGKTAFVLSQGAIVKVDLSGDSAKKKGVAIQGRMNIHSAKEREYLFEHIWRQVREKFYVEDLHNVDWDFYRSAYAPKLASITNNRDFSVMASEMLGELNGSHTGCRYYPRHGNADETASLGAYYDWDYEGPGLKIAEIIEKGPLTKSDVKIEAGMVIQAINGATVTAGANVYSLLNHQADNRVRLTIFDPTTEKTFDQIVEPIDLGRESNLMYQRWTKQRRDAVDRLSEYRLGYVHVRGMNDPSFRDVFSEVLGRDYRKEAVIIDTRFNGGGWLAEDLITFLNGKQYSTTVPRGRELGVEPLKTWTKPSIVIMSEGNYSDAHIFPYGYKATGVGKLVGMPAAGTGTAVWWERLHTGDLVFGIPQVGIRGIDGKMLENNQLEPDYKINNDPGSLARGEDKQLEKAVEVLLEQVSGSK